jgi:hypothetical protein
LLCTAPDKVSNGYSSGVQAPWDLQRITLRSAACNFVNAILDEWARANMPGAVAANVANAPAGSQPAATGCFAGDPACDWDPKDFVKGMEDLVQTQIENVAAPKIEADYNFCKTYFQEAKADPKINKGDDLTKNEMGLLAGLKAKLQGSYNKIKGTPVLDSGPVAKSFKAQVGGDHTASFGQLKQNAETWGNDLFGVGYSYSMGWEVPLEWQHTRDAAHPYQLCDFGLGVWGKLQSWAYAFGSDKFDILDVKLAAGINDPLNQVLPTRSNEAGFDAQIVIAGDELVNKKQTFDWSRPPTFNLGQGANSWMLFEAPFQIAFVTLEISAGVGYEWSANASIGPEHVSTCGGGGGQPKIRLGAKLDPSAKLEAVVEAYASIAGLAGIGVEVDLELLGLSLPAEAEFYLGNANTAMNPGASGFGFGADTSLPMNFHTLDGSLRLYAEALFTKLFDAEIINWHGLQATVPLFNAGAFLPVADLDSVGDIGLHDPSAMLNNL